MEPTRHLDTAALETSMEEVCRQRDALQRRLEVEEALERVRARTMAMRRSDELAEILTGLRKPQKMISPKYFYDERGSQLFDAITHLPEYYPTETEFGIMRDNIEEIADLIGPTASLIEYGSGSSRKTRILLEHLTNPRLTPGKIPTDVHGGLEPIFADRLSQLDELWIDADVD